MSSERVVPSLSRISGFPAAILKIHSRFLSEATEFFFGCKGRMRSRKGLYDLGRKAIYMIVAVIVISVVFLYSRSIFVDSQSKTFEKFSEAEPYDMMYIAISSPHCFGYIDQTTGRTYPGMIDIDKFSNSRIDNCFLYSEGKVAFRLKFSGEGGIAKEDITKEGIAVEKNKKQQVLEKKQNMDGLDRWMKIGDEIANPITFTQSVLVKVNGSIQPGIFVMEVENVR